MSWFRSTGVACAVIAGFAAVAVVGCNGAKDGTGLNKAEPEIPKVPVPPENGPKLGATAEVTPVLERPAGKAKQLGYLRAGAKVARADKPYSRDGCEGGWYPVRPRGFVCAGQAATVDLNHPTLLAMALQPKLDQPLPYTYARTTRETPLYERHDKRDDAVREVGKLRARSSMAVIGSWSAIDPEGKPQSLALLTNGRFVRATDLRAAETSSFAGAELGPKAGLPVAFVVKRGVRAWRVDGRDAEKMNLLNYHEVLMLTGRYRTISGVRHWALDDERWVRHPDVTVVYRRNVFPDFVKNDTKWLDVSIVTGTLVVYEGKRPLFATLVSVGRDRLGDPKTTASTAQGTFDVVGKHVTARLDPKTLEENYDVFDLPWAIELSSGQLLSGAYWHDRFGIDNGPGHVQLSPADAARLWHWVEPQLPQGWHGVTDPPGDKRVIVNIRK
jgi:hypothetical protein